MKLMTSSVYTETVSGGNRSININSIANHNVGTFPNSGNPNRIKVNNYSFVVPASPSKNAVVTSLYTIGATNTGDPAYKFGVLFSGVVVDPVAAEFFQNPSTGEENKDWNESALSSSIDLGTDCNNAHVQPDGTYHYHGTPSAFVSDLGIDGSTPVQLGYAADGFPIYYKYGNKGGAVVELTSSYRLKSGTRGGNGTTAPDGSYDGTYTQDYEYVNGLGDLDECNGYDDPTLGYIYVITDTYPSIPRCFRGTPSDDFKLGP